EVEIAHQSGRHEVLLAQVVIDARAAVATEVAWRQLALVAAHQFLPPGETKILGGHDHSRQALAGPPLASAAVAVPQPLRIRQLVGHLATQALSLIRPSHLAPSVGVARVSTTLPPGTPPGSRPAQPLCTPSNVGGSRGEPAPPVVSWPRRLRPHIGDAYSVVARTGSAATFVRRSYSRRSGPGAHQFHLPRSAISEGTSRPRMTNASISTARAMPRPSSLMNTSFDVTNAPIATEKRSAAAVTIRPVRSRPIATARWSGI